MIAKKKYWKRIPAFFTGVLALISMLFIYNSLTQIETGGFFKSTLIYLVGYFVFGIVFGAIWHNKHWYWAIWLIFPMLIVTGISILFAGIYLNNFLMNDLPTIFISFFAAIVGNFIGARLFSGGK